MIGRFVFGVPPLLPPVCLSILRLPPFLPPIGRVDLNWAVEGEEKVVVGREGQKGCAVFWGCDFKQIDEKRGRVLIEAASAAGCPESARFFSCLRALCAHR